MVSFPLETWYMVHALQPLRGVAVKNSNHSLTGWTCSSHICILSSWSMHSYVSLSEALDRNLQAPLLSTPYVRGKEKLSRHFPHSQYQILFYSQPNPLTLPPPSSLPSLLAHKQRESFHQSSLSDVTAQVCTDPATLHLFCGQRENGFFPIFVSCLIPSR